jgi:hypothetical protein
MLRPGNAGSNTAAEHIEVTRVALAQMPRHQRRRGPFGPPRQNVTARTTDPAGEFCTRYTSATRMPVSGAQHGCTP